MSLEEWWRDSSQKFFEVWKVLNKSTMKYFVDSEK